MLVELIYVQLEYADCLVAGGSGVGSYVAAKYLQLAANQNPSDIQETGPGLFIRE
jgi:hypothetical protein